jgi:uncharacterized membrane protein YfcA
VLIGLLAGLLGVVGGGIVAVPVLLDIFSIMGLGEAKAVVLAVGTAQASILVPPLSAVLAHWRAGTIERSAGGGVERSARRWTVDALGDVALFCEAALSLPALFVAPVTARWSARAPVSVLRRLFALCLAVIALRLFLRN